jgi:hypothetical protein
LYLRATMAAGISVFVGGIHLPSKHVGDLIKPATVISASCDKNEQFAV